jgi:hypothetical protein
VLLLYPHFRRERAPVNGNVVSRSVFFAIHSGLSPEEAMSEVVKQGGAVGVKRNGDPNLLKIWLDGSDK